MEMVAKETTADLFARLFWALAPSTGKIVYEAWPGRTAPEAAEIDRSLAAAASAQVPKDIQDYLAGWTPKRWRQAPSLTDLRQRQFVVAQCIDRSFDAVHPRCCFGGVRLTGPQRHYRDHRYRTGCYNQNTDHGRVVPKAPLRPAAEAGADSGARFDTHFTYLSLVTWRSDEYPFDLSIRVLPAIDDVSEFSEPVRIGFVPLAESASDLKLSTLLKGNRPFIDVSPADDVALANRAAAAIRALADQKVHIVLFPEWCVGPKTGEAIQRTLAETGRSSSLLLVIAGSGLRPARAADGTMPLHGECIVYNRYGRVLWRQRKLVPYLMSLDAIRRYRLPSTADAAHCENFLPGDRMEITESAVLGRMMVLLCEDLNQHVPGRTICESMAPDWIFSLILDGSIELGRWMYQRSSRAASDYRCRVVVANSMALAAHQAEAKQESQPSGDRRPTGKAANCGIGLCVDDRDSRRYKIVETELLVKSSPVVASLEWTADRWPRAKISPENTDCQDEQAMIPSASLPSE